MFIMYPVDHSFHPLIGHIETLVTTDPQFIGVGDLISFQLKTQVFKSFVEKKDFLLPMVVTGKLYFFVIPPSIETEVLGYVIPSASMIPDIVLKKAPFVRDIEIMAQIQTFAIEYDLTYCPKLSEIFCSSFSNLSLVRERLMPEVDNAHIH